MGVRVWGVANDRLIEVEAELAPGAGIRIEGLPDGRTRTTANRVRAALVNSGLVEEVPPSTIHLEPSVPAGTTSDLDLAIALAALGLVGLLSAELSWVLAVGRLGLDGTIFSHGLEKPASIVTVVTSLRSASL